MYAEDTPIIMDLKSTIAFVKSMVLDVVEVTSIENIEKIKTQPSSSQLVTVLGLRHMQRLCVDSLIKSFQVIAKDIDSTTPKSFDALVTLMQTKTAGRDAVLDNESHRNVVVARMLANAASLSVTPMPSIDESAHAAHASVKTLKVVVTALEQFLEKIQIK